MSTFTLYGNPTFPAVARVQLAIDEVGFTDYEAKDVDLFGGGNKGEYTKLNPYGKIPTLVAPCGAAIYESRAIAKFLARVHPEQFASLVPDPSDPLAIAQFEQAEQTEIAYFSEPMGKIAYEMFYKQLFGAEADMAVVEKERKSIAKHLDVCEKELAGGKYMAGKEYGLVDIFYVPFFMKMFDCGMTEEVETRPNVKAWWERVKGRPVVAKFLAESPTLEMYKKMMAEKKA